MSQNLLSMEPLIGAEALSDSFVWRLYDVCLSCLSQTSGLT